jgi:uncharacterized protein DUF5947
MNLRTTNYKVRRTFIANMTTDEFNNEHPEQIGNSFDVLRRFIRSRSVPVERCDMCSAALGADHLHLVEPPTRRLICACQACAVLFSDASSTKYRRVPRRVRALSNFHMSDSQWEGLMIPINMAFFFQSSVANKVIVLYPSPAGATESLLDFDSWQEIVQANPYLQQMESDTEALLINRVQKASDYFIVPIDECYRLVGLIRTKWKGLSGGVEVWEAISDFFAELRCRSTKVAGVAHA